MATLTSGIAATIGEQSPVASTVCLGKIISHVELDGDRPRPSSDFVLPEGVVYLDGNSLGAMPVQASARARRVVEEEWAGGLIRSWNDADWVSLARRVGDRIGALIGARPGTVIACDSTSWKRPSRNRLDPEDPSTHWIPRRRNPRWRHSA